MNVLRNPAGHGSLLVVAFVALNIIMLMVLFSAGHVERKLWFSGNNERQQENAKADPSLPIFLDVVTVTSSTTIILTNTATSTAPSTATEPVTATATATATVTDHRIDSANPPGPGFCDVCGPGDALCTLYGELNLARSRVYEGANARFHRVIANAMAGKPTKIGALGGSVTKGHALPHNHLENWTVLFLEAWKKLFPKSKTTLINGAVPATGSDYFSMCFGEHVDEDVDLVIIELAINDPREEWAAIAYEWLMRGLLALPKNPAVINLHTMALIFDTITMGGDIHTPIAEYYDSPVISLRNMLLPHILKHPNLDVYYFTKGEDGEPDWRHVGIPGHRILADLLVAYTQRQICAVEKERFNSRKKYISADGTLPGIDELEDVPRLRIFQQYDRETVTAPITPMCQSTRTKKHPLTPIENHGWQEWTNPGQPDKPYLVAWEPGATVKFAVVSAVMGRVRITYLRSKTFGLGDAWCWIDNDKNNGEWVVSWWDYDYNLAHVAGITVDATPGKHTLSCEVMKTTSDPGGGHEFRLISVDAS